LRDVERGARQFSEDVTREVVIVVEWRGRGFVILTVCAHAARAAWRAPPLPLRYALCVIPRSSRAATRTLVWVWGRLGD